MNVVLYFLKICVPYVKFINLIVFEKNTVNYSNINLEQLVHDFEKINF
jgi:hypothetical protein